MTSFSSATLEAFDFAAGLLLKAQHAIVLSGAGLSTPSGIPDFRSEGTGLWSRDEPLEVASLLTFRTHPEFFFEWFRPLAGQIFSARPNAAHYALAELETAGHIRAVLTQNIDLLHDKAGSQKVLELHGTLRTLSCTRCYTRVGYEGYLPAFVERDILPHCPNCDGLLKPDVILFGEQLPYQVLQAAQHEARQSDLFIVVGSSLEVLPVAGLPMLALESGAHLIIINNSPTYLNVRADVVFDQDVAEVLPEIKKRVIDE